MKQYDLAVLGAGPGGYEAAIRAAQLGAKTVIIEKEHIGGTCLNVGCIPTKVLLKNVEIIHGIKSGRKRGIKINGELELNYAKAVKTKDKSVKQLVNGIAGLLASNNIDVINGTGYPKKNHTVDIVHNDGSSETVGYDKLIIATGSRPSLPPIEGIENENILTSNEILSISEIPERLIIIGAGVIGSEIGTVFNAYGSKVTMIEMMSHAVGNLDEMLSESMDGILQEQGITLITDTAVKAFNRTENGEIDVLMESKQGEKSVITGDKVLISIGRRPNVEELAELDLKMDGKFVAVTDNLETSDKDIYAIGDVTGKKQLAHVASEMGIIAAENAMGSYKAMSYDIIPACIYTIPEIASVGMTEREAVAKYHDISTGIFPLMACGKAVATDCADGQFKIVADNETKKILGAHLVGHGATEIIAEIAAYMKMDATVDDIIETVHAHPTISESVAEAARDIYGMTIHMPAKKNK